MSEERTVEMVVSCVMCGAIVIITVREKDYLTFMSPNRPHVQDIFPYLTPAERELLISHTCESCWNDMFDALEQYDSEE